MLEATRGLTLDQLRQGGTDHMPPLTGSSRILESSQGAALLAQVRVANAVAPVAAAAGLAGLAAQAGSPVEAARVMSRIRFERVSAAVRRPLEQTRREARSKPGTDRFGLASGTRWVLVGGRRHRRSTLAAILQQTPGLEHTVLRNGSTWSERPTREGLLRTALDDMAFSPNSALLVQADGAVEYDAVWLAGALGVPCVVVQIVDDERTSTRIAAFERFAASEHQLWRLQPVTWLEVSPEHRRVDAFDATTGHRYRNAHHDLVTALRHFGAASVIGRDLEHFAQENEDYPNIVRPIADWIRRDIRRSADAVSVCSTIAERLWQQPRDSRAETASSQLENLMLERPLSDLEPLVESALHVGRVAFGDQLRLRRLFLDNDYPTVAAAAAETNDRNTRMLVAEATAAVGLIQRLADSSSVGPNSNTAETAPGTSAERIVCFLHASRPQQSGGYAIRAHGIFRALVKQGVDIMPVTRPGFPDELPPTATDARVPTPDVVDGVTYRRLNATVLREAGEAAYMAACVDAYKAELERLEATAVHVRSTFLIAVPAIIAAHEMGLRVVYEVSGLWELVYADREAPESLNRRAPFAQRFEELAAEAADRILTMNTAMIDLLVGRGANAEKISLAPNAVDVAAFREDPAVISTEAPVIGYIGSIVDYEALPDLVGAAGILRDRGLEFSLVVIGDGLAMPSLKSAVARLELGDRVKIRGRIPHDQVRAEYLRMAIMAYPRHSTPATDVITPLKPFEALAMNKAVVVSDVPPLKEIAGDDERAMVFPSGDVVALADRLQNLLEDPVLRSNLGARGRSWVMAERSWEMVVRSFQDAYNQLHGSAPAS